MRVQRFGVRLGLSLAGAVAIASLAQPGLRAQNDHGHAATADRRPDTPESAARRSAFVRAVREATRRFLDPAVAMSEGYLPQFGCVTGSSEGVMGVHFVNGGLVNDGAAARRTSGVARLRAAAEQPVPTGRRRLPGDVGGVACDECCASAI